MPENYPQSKKCPVAIIGRREDTCNYEAALSRLGIPCFTTLSPNKIYSCGGVLLPGGGDITPAFFGQKTTGSRHIDTELDILQLEAVEQAIRCRKPVLGICKGMQILNVFFGGTIIQHMEDAVLHQYQNGDQMHDTAIVHGTFLYAIYGSSLVVNSAHHQCLGRLGKGLLLAQYASPSPAPEAIFHEKLPIYGVQWHPERLAPDGDKLLCFFRSLLL